MNNIKISKYENIKLCFNQIKRKMHKMMILEYNLQNVSKVQKLCLDRKSTRLNSHLVISYAVFCLKKKKRARTQVPARSLRRRQAARAARRVTVHSAGSSGRGVCRKGRTAGPASGHNLRRSTVLPQA